MTSQTIVTNIPLLDLDLDIDYSLDLGALAAELAALVIRPDDDENE